MTRILFLWAVSIGLYILKISIKPARESCRFLFATGQGWKRYLTGFRKFRDLENFNKNCKGVDLENLLKSENYEKIMKNPKYNSRTVACNDINGSTADVKSAEI